MSGLSSNAPCGSAIMTTKQASTSLRCATTEQNLQIPLPLLPLLSGRSCQAHEPCTSIIMARLSISLHFRWNITYKHKTDFRERLHRARRDAEAYHKSYDTTLKENPIFSRHARARIRKISNDDELDDGSSLILMESRTDLVFVQVMSLQCIKVWRDIKRDQACFVYVCVMFLRATSPCVAGGFCNVQIPMYLLCYSTLPCVELVDRIVRNASGNNSRSEPWCRRISG
jgi:hypothetical protein